MTNQLGFYFDASLCTGCKVCQVACQDKNHLPPEIIWRKVVQYGGGNWIPQGDIHVPNNLGIVSLSAACMHCDQPTCMQVCPTAAISKRSDGVVLIDQSKCIGCRYCQWACPYDAPRFDEAAGVMTKCTFCEDLLGKGENPACVDACVMRAIKFGEMDELRAKYGNVNAVEPLPEAKYTMPSLVITPHKHSQISGTGTGRILNLPEEM
ncbi:MAG: dimethylsulfoxide reductase subunit B [Chloroflexi bacterium]|nr:dimethylsulfoxide reductase subunit B [Chloroflexota bacterium]